MAELAADEINQNADSKAVVPRNILLPFILLTSCFALWGLAHNMTDILVAQFRKVFTLSDAQSSLVQMAFYGAYFCLALPAALLIRRFSYKAGILTGLGLFSLGALLFYPASITAQYSHFLTALFILAGGLSILETSVHPYILYIGPPSTAIQRLNLAQSFNPLGSIIGVLIGKFYILSQLHPASDWERSLMEPLALEAIQSNELMAVMVPYIGVAVIIAFIWLCTVFCKMPVITSSTPADETQTVRRVYKRLLQNRIFVQGVIAQFLYVGIQIGCWSWTIRYVMAHTSTSEAEASTYYLYSILLFCGTRFVCTSLMSVIQPARLLGGLAALGVMLSSVVVFNTGMFGIYALIAISGCMSLMFPTIYGLACNGLGDDAKLGSSCLVMSLVGGAVITFLMGKVSDAAGINMAFLLPMACFSYLVWFGFRSSRVHTNNTY